MKSQRHGASAQRVCVETCLFETLANVLLFMPCVVHSCTCLKGHAPCTPPGNRFLMGELPRRFVLALSAFDQLPLCVPKLFKADLQASVCVCVMQRCERLMHI